MEEVTTEERLRRLEDVHGEVSLGDRLWAADNLRGLKAYADQIEKQNRMLKEQLGIWKRKAGENQLIAGRWQYLFETSQKCVNRIEDIFEYTWQKMGKTDLRDYVHEELSRLAEAVSKVRKSPTEEQEKK
jgi:hypothetical protein